MKWIYLQALGIWLLLVVVAIMNGSLRQFTYGKLMPELTAHQISTVTCVLLFGAVFYLFFRYTKAEFGLMDLFLIGSIWLLMTILFEFGFGHFVMGHPWERLLGDYNIIKGKVWLAVLLWTWLGPLLMGSIANGDLSILGIGANRIARGS